MIKLTKKQTVQVFQVAMELLTKTKQSPFIALLIRAKELDDENYCTSAASIREYLLPNLPERACYNLLNRLATEGYLEKRADENFEITEKGIASAEDNSIWEGEKGIYNVYITQSNLLEQKIIAIVATDRQNDTQEKSKTDKGTPKFIQDFQNTVMQLKNTEQRIEKIENKCFQLPDEVWDMELTSSVKKETVLYLKSKYNSFQKEMSFTAEDLESHFLAAQFGENYKNNHVSVNFDANNLLFVRDAFITKPNISGEEFEDTTLKNIKYRPATKNDATQWYEALLTDNIDRYFMNDASFEAHSSEHAKLFEAHFKLKTIKKQEIIKIMQREKSNFYCIAKLETIDFLSF